MSCVVHPHATGGEMLCIGLMPHEGQPPEEKYAEWVMLRRGGGPCTCERQGHCLIAMVALPNGIGIACSYLGPPQSPRFTVQVVKDATEWLIDLEYAESTATLEEALASYEKLKTKWMNPV